jgi:hypothetical protein
VADYINEDSVIYGPGRVAFSDAARTDGFLGFLGTLIAFRWASGFFHGQHGRSYRSHQAPDPQHAVCVHTSIAGVIASILFTVINKSAQGGAQRRFPGFTPR